MANRADAAHGQSRKRKGVRSADVFNSEFTAFRIACESVRSVDMVEDVPSRGCIIPSLGWRKSGSGLVGLLRKRRRKATGSELLAGAQAFVGRVGGRKIGGVSRARS